MSTLAGASDSPDLMTLPQMRASLHDGQYRLVVQQGQEMDTADGLALATEAMNAQLLLGLADHKTKTAKRAMKTAKAALELEPKNPEAQFQYALAYGFYGRHASSITAWRKKLPQKIRAEIEKAAVLLPGDSRVEALKGAWHLSLLHKGRNWNVEKRYGASESQGVQSFQSALKTHKGDIIITTNFLMLEYVLAPETRAEKTQKGLMDLVSRTPKNHVERTLILQMHGVLDGFKDDSALARAEKFLNQ